VADALPLYARCDALALPSRWEGCPYSLLEGMAARLPVVAADLFALREILATTPARDEDGASASPAAASTCGVLCRAHPREFARALARLKHDAPRRVALGDAARARIESRLTLERMADETVRVYDALGR
jgi:glycosyltransferase involved in cell wall biosynthesis